MMKINNDGHAIFDENLEIFFSKKKIISSGYTFANHFTAGKEFLSF